MYYSKCRALIYKRYTFGSSFALLEMVAKELHVEGYDALVQLIGSDAECQVSLTYNCQTKAISFLFHRPSVNFLPILLTPPPPPLNCAPSNPTSHDALTPAIIDPVFDVRRIVCSSSSAGRWTQLLA